MKKLLAIVLSLVLVLSLCACNAKPAETTGAAAADGYKSFTVTAVHADGSERTFSCKTRSTMLGEVLEAEGFIESEGADDGMFHTVDGEKADWNENGSYWAFYVGEEYAMKGIYETEITDGGEYRLVYTVG